MGNGQSCKIVGTGDVCLETELGCKLLLKKVRHVPEIRLNLISTGQLDDEGYNKVTEIFKNFHAAVERETGMKLECVRADNGGEYRGPFENYCRTHSIKLEKTRVRCMLSQAKLSKSFWGEAMRTAFDLINLTPSVALDGDVPQQEHLVCRLRKSLYGLKQAPRQWYKKFDSFMLSHGYIRTTSDQCVFVKQFSDGDFIILLLYVDDMLLVGHDMSKIAELKKELSN
ncbi:hypothetical protein CRG98_042960 [Punica granatum]|uniref:Uncharacterized protein n=1 Tax=Punica granatum TaxID=22663 RepID=A0A2I0HY82_PUNGR|nr:hypothetical protein CRG98_042960 [Punica granatum]